MVRWKKHLNPEIVKGPWTKEEDEKVRKTEAFKISQTLGLD